MLAASLLTYPGTLHTGSAPGWFALGYVSLFSMLIGTIFWYKGLTLGGIAEVGQRQLLQPFFGLALSALLLHEQVSMLMVTITPSVIIYVIGSKLFAQ